MTKLKNTKKGMAKKALSISLVAAMLATSNVPVWAAEFTDGTDAVVEAPVVETPVEDEFTAEPVAETFSAETVEENNEASTLSTSVTTSKNYNFDNIQVDSEKINVTWDKFTNLGDLFKAGSVVTKNDGNPVTDLSKLSGVIRYDGQWDEANVKTLNSADFTQATGYGINGKDSAGKHLEMLIFETDATGVKNIVKVIDLGTFKKVDLNDTGLAVTAGTATYNGQEKKVNPSKIDTTKVTANYSADLSGLTVDSFNWNFSTNADYVNAGSKVTAVGTLKTSITGYTDTITAPAYIIQKRTLADGDIVVKVKNPGKVFSYENNANTVVDKAEVDVFLKDFSVTDKTVASSISLNEYVKEVKVDTDSVGKGKTLNVTFDADALKASANFKETAPANVDSTSNKETATEDKDTQVEVGTLDLAGCEVTLKSPVKADSNSTNVKDAIKVSIKKDGKELKLDSNDYVITLKSGDYSKPGTFSGVITVNGNGSNVTGSKTLDLVTVKQAFSADCKFEDNWEYLTKDSTKVSNRQKALDYANGKEVAFTDELGRFSPDGTSFGDQDNFQITYDNNINATHGESVAKLTVTAIAGDYKGCTQDFYFRIDPSQVKLSTTEKENTVTTNVKKEVGGIAVNESYTDASQYADAIGLTINGTNGKTGKDEIISNATAKDYTVEYSFVKKDNHGTESDNSTDSAIKVVATLKENGNFKGEVTSGGITLDNGVSGKIETLTETNGVITLYVPIVDKSIETLDISLEKDTFTFTGETIEPKVIAKENGTVLKDSLVKVIGIKDGINAGKATVTVEVTGYTGKKELTATINPVDITNVKFEIKKGQEARYNGKQQKPTIAQDNDPSTTKDETVLESSATAQVKLDKVVLSKMFDIAYGKNVNAGKEAGTVTLTPKATYAKNFNGSSLTANFEILQAILKANAADTTLKLADATGKKIAVSNSTISEVMTWTGDVVKFAKAEINDANIVNDEPSSVKFDENAYEIAYANAVDATTNNANAKAYIAVVGKGNFTGAYSIVKAKNGAVSVELTSDVEEANKATAGTYEVLLTGVLKDTAASYDIKAGRFVAKDVTVANGVYAGGLTVKPVVTVKDTDTEKVLTEDVDFEIKIEDSSKAINATTTPIKFTIVGKGKYNGVEVTKFSNGKDLEYCIDKKDLKDAFVSVKKAEDGSLELTVMNGNVVEKTEKFDVKDNGDGTATVSVVDGGKNYTGTATAKINDPAEDTYVGQAMIKEVKVVGNKATVILDGEADEAVGYDYVISTVEDYKNGRLPNGINKNQLITETSYQYLQKGTYYAYCHAWKKVNGKKVFGEWSNIVEFNVYTTTPSTPAITSVKVSKNTVTVTYTKCKDATGYDIVLGSAKKKVNGEMRPVQYGKLVKKVTNGDKVTATFTKVPKGTYYVGLHAYNRSRQDNKKVFSPWSATKTIKVK